jgi:aminoglycoside phosphotransferase (APT) family kinase protein
MAGRWHNRVPDHAWLFRGWIDRHRQPEAVAGGLSVLDGVSARSEVETRLGRSLEDARRLIMRQPELKMALERLPPTLCHHDAVAANVFPRVRDTEPETVLIDWESIGPGPAGADLASLLFSSARRGDISARTAAVLLPTALEAYADGVAEIGGAIDQSQLRLGLFAAIGLRWTLVRDVIRAMEGASTARRGSIPDEPPEEALEQLIALTTILFEAADEARRLLPP